MLDDEHYVRRIDADNALAVTATQPEQLSYTPALTLEAIDKDKIDQVVFVGMGGSALAAALCQNWWSDRLAVPFIVIRDYKLPAYANDRTLIICASYSGNTEEVLSCFIEAKRIQAQIIVMASGGELRDLAQADNSTFIELPTGYQPRMAVWYGVKSLATLFEALKLVEDATNELQQAEGLLRSAAKAWELSVPTDSNYAKQIAEQLMGKAVWIYASASLASAAYKWKIDFNENAKSVASWNELPEFNHNEFIGWTSHPVEKPFGIVELRSHLDHPQVQKRFDLSNRLLSGQMPAPIEVEVKGQNRLEQLLWSCLLGDFVSVYSGILNGVNPVRVETIEKLKGQL
ncbi:MAG: bifunctional phosphoglucose/phosphomannose isomerase [Candidatus Saccharimonadales bacterium]